MYFNEKGSSLFIVTIACFLKFAKLKDGQNAKEISVGNHNQLFSEIFLINESMRQLEMDIDKLHNGLNEQFDIVSGIKRKDLTDDVNKPLEKSSNQSEIINKYFNDINKKLLILNDNAIETLKVHDQHLMNKTEVILEIITNLNNCVMSKSQQEDSYETTNKIKESLQQLDQQMERFNSLKEKFNNFNKQEAILEKKTENLAQLFNEINTKLKSQNRYFENLEKLVPIMQSAGKTLDEYIIRREERHQHFRNRCQDGNCHHFHHSRHHH